jgi:hypothetical protein
LFMLFMFGECNLWNLGQLEVMISFLRRLEIGGTN